MLFVNPALKMDSAMEIAKFSRREIGRRSIRKAISKKMNRLKEQARKAAHAQNMRNRRQSTAVNVTEVTVGGTTITGTTLSDITNSDITISTALSAHSNQMGTKKKAKAVHKSSKRAFAKVQLSQSSRRTPNQVVKAGRGHRGSTNCNEHMNGPSMKPLIIKTKFHLQRLPVKNIM